MKKILLLVVCFMIVCMLGAKAQSASAIMLMHQGQAKMYSNQQLPTVINEAEAGDTIFLSSGVYSVLSGLTIDKPLSIIGTGQNTIISGDVTVNLDSTATIDCRLLDGLKLTHSLNIIQNVNTITIRKCWISNVLFMRENAGTLMVDRCFARSLIPVTGYNGSFSATNSVFYQYGGDESSYQLTGNVELTNCYLHWFYSEDHNGNATFVNSIIANMENSAQTNMFINCGGDGPMGYSSHGRFESCYSMIGGTGMGSFDTVTYFPTYNSGAFSSENLRSMGYLGTDGTIIGAEGGNTPYNLTPSLPTVSQSSFSVDNSTRTLNVTLTVTAE